MSFGVVRLRKYNEGAVGGIEQHMERRATNSNTNPDIHRGKSKNNYDLADNFDRTFKSLIKERLNKGVKIPKKDKRNIVMAELLFSASPQFFENMSADQIRQYFQKCVEFAKKKYGEDNIISAIVHLDEETPHMHLMFVPVTKDNKLCAKDLFNGKDKMRQLQDEAHEQVFEQYGLERGIPKPDTKHIETLDWKIDQRINELNRLETKYNELEQKAKSNEYYKLQKYARDIKKRLFETYEIIQNDDKLLSAYKEALEKFERFKNQNSEDREI